MIYRYRYRYSNSTGVSVSVSSSELIMSPRYDGSVSGLPLVGAYVGAMGEGRVVGITEGPEGEDDGALVPYTITVLGENAKRPT